MNETLNQNKVNFVCPKCKGSLNSNNNTYLCEKCNCSYHIIDGVPDFLLQKNLPRASSRIAKVMDLVAPIYESKLFVTLLFRLSGVRKGVDLTNKIAEFHANALKDVTGNILDVACGPATYSRKLTLPNRIVYGIDISLGVLKQGYLNAKKENINGMNLSRANVDELPFGNNFFDGVVCSGSLHLFPNKVLSLREIGRTMKSKAILSVQTFVSGKTIINRYLQKQTWIHTFTISEIKDILKEAGFDNLKYDIDGITLTFTARKI